MRSLAQRVAAYNARMQSSLVNPVLTAMESQQVANHTAHVNFFYPKQVALRDILNSDVPNLGLWFAYEAFNEEMYSLARRMSGAAAVTAATVLVTKYSASVCQAATLKKIALDVWSITVP